MTGEDKSKRSGTIRVEYKLDDPPAIVWRTLTEPELLGRWLMPNDIRPEVGARFTFRGDPNPWWDGVAHCEVLEVQAHQRLVYRWCNDPQRLQRKNTDLDTVVSWTLTPTPDGGTTLSLDHSGFDPEGFAYKAMGSGWSGKKARIQEVISQINRA